MQLRVECTLFCNVPSRVRTHAVFVIGLYELLGNPTHSATRALSEISLRYTILHGMFYESLNSGCLPSSQIVEH